MKRKLITKILRNRILPAVVAFAVVTAGVCSMPKTVHAEVWTDVAQEMTLGETVHSTIKTGDFYGAIEANSSSDYYWHVYKFTMPKDGLLDIAFESALEKYFAPTGYYSDGVSKYGGFAIFSKLNPDNLIWRSNYVDGNVMTFSYSASREMYYGSRQISLKAGDYYFVVRRGRICDTPYYLTVSYQEPVIHAVSIALDKTKLKMQAGDSQQIKASLLPDNATNKNMVWRSTSPSVVTVENGLVKAVSAGKASIIVSSEDGAVSAVCEVEVTALNESYEYRILEDNGAEITKYTGTETNITVPELMGDSTVTAIGDYIFQNCQDLVSVSIPENVTTIGDCVFQNCESMESVELPRSMTSIGDYAFQNCGSLTKIEIPDNVTSIGKAAFGSSGLTTLAVPNKVTRIESLAFWDCQELGSIAIPDSVKTIGPDAFKGCNGVTIYGEIGSAAETYATQNDIPFRQIDLYDPNGTVKPEPVEPKPEKAGIGDVNLNGRVDLSDAQLCLKAALNLTTLSQEQQSYADVDQNGAINLRDAQLILKAALNMIVLE